MLKLETTYNLEENVNNMDRTIEGTAILDKLLENFGVYTHYIERRKIQEGLEAMVHFNIWNEQDLVDKLDKLFSEYDKIYNFIKNSDYYKTIPETRKKSMLDEFNLVYVSIKFLLPDMFNMISELRRKQEEENKEKQIVENFLNDLKKL